MNRINQVLKINILINTVSQLVKGLGNIGQKSIVLEKRNDVKTGSTQTNGTQNSPTKVSTQTNGTHNSPIKVSTKHTN